MIPGEKVGLRTRAWGILIDLIVLNIIQIVVVALLNEVRGILGFNLLVWIAYSVYFEGGRGATPGKILLGIRIVRVDGGSPDYQQVFFRCLVKLVPLLALLLSTLAVVGSGFPPLLRAGAILTGLLPSLLWAVTLHRHPMRQAPHDRLARTCVIRIF